MIYPIYRPSAPRLADLQAAVLKRGREAKITLDAAHESIDSTAQTRVILLLQADDRRRDLWWTTVHWSCSCKLMWEGNKCLDLKSMSVRQVSVDREPDII